MSGHPGVGAIESRIVAAIAQGAVTSRELAARIGEPLSDVHRALVRLVETGLVDAAEGHVRLTDKGRQRVATDEERDAAVQQLAQAFAQGRLSSAELDERTGRALLGSLFVLFGSDAGDRVAGLVLLALTAPPLLGLWRWARPRR